MERPLITVLVAYGVSGIAGGIFTYVATKMAIDWIPLIKHQGDNQNETMNLGARSYVFCSLIGNLLSILFAVLGGLIWKGAIKLF